MGLCMLQLMSLLIGLNLIYSKLILHFYVNIFVGDPKLDLDLC